MGKIEVIQKYVSILIVLNKPIEKFYMYGQKEDGSVQAQEMLFKEGRNVIQLPQENAREFIKGLEDFAETGTIQKIEVL